MCLANALAPFGSMRGQLMGPREEKKIRMLKVAHVEINNQEFVTPRRSRCGGKSSAE